MHRKIAEGAMKIFAALGLFIVLAGGTTFAQTLSALRVDIPYSYASALKHFRRVFTHSALIRAAGGLM